MKKRGVFFSIDALIAVGILVLVIMIAYPVLKVTKNESEINKDVLISLSNIKVIEVNDSYIQTLSQNGVINDSNKSVLEQIGEFYVTNVSLATYLANVTLSEIRTNKNIGLWFGDTLIFSINSTPYEGATSIISARESLSGISQGNVTKGYVSKAWLKKIVNKKTILIIKGDLMCGKWSDAQSYCGPAKTDIIYEINIPENATVLNAFWLVEPSWQGEGQFKLWINSNEIHSGAVQYFQVFNITQYLLPGKNVAILNSTTGGDDGASHIVVEYNTPDLITLEDQKKFYFNKMKSSAILYHEKAIIVTNPINFLNVKLNTSSSTQLLIRLRATTVTIGTKSPINNIINFTSSEILGNLTTAGITYSNLSNEYFYVIAKVGSAGEVKLNENSFVEINTSSSTEIPFGTIDITQEIKLNQSLNRIQDDTFYRNLIWQFFLPKNSTAVIADWQLGWLKTGSSSLEQEAKANGIWLYDSPPDPFISTFNRFGYTPNLAQGLFKDGANNFTLDFGSNYGVSNTSSYGSLTFFLRSFVNYGNVYEKAQGGNRTIIFEDGQSKNLLIGNSNDTWDPDKDAIDNAVERLLTQLDANNNGKIDISIDQTSLEIGNLDIAGVPYLWSTEAQVRIWE
ncbi:MAG: hypothetical protein Q7S27_03650 [Nanoarchaeota archaeon]|nr:hypothetical protein [Nanoarchaeota archaeon]